MKKFKLGIIGCGNIMNTHVARLQTSEIIEVTAVCDIVMEQALKVAAVCNDPFITTDYKTMVGHVDGVLIALPHELHYECGMFFARNKVNILMEKPLCNTEEECLRLIETCEEEGVTLMCAYPVRFRPGLLKLKELVDSGDYGKPFMVSYWTEQFTPADELSWTATSKLGGGQLFSHGCHYIDFLLWFLGRPVSGTHVGTRVGTPWLLKEGSSMVTMKFENGAIAYHGATWGARGTKLGYACHVHCEKAMFEYDVYEGVIRMYDAKREHIPGEEDAPRGTRVVWSGVNGKKNMADQMQHFIDCCRTGKRPLTDARLVLQSFRVVWRLYDAEKRGTLADLRGLGLEDAYK